MRLDELVKLIIATNHAWKRQRDLWGADSATARMLQGRKSSLQTQLLTSFPKDTYLKLDEDNQEGEAHYLLTKPSASYKQRMEDEKWL